MDKRDFVINRVKALVGDPVLAALPTEVAAVDTAIRMANLKYYTACPYKYTSIVTVDVNDQGMYIQNIPDLIASAFNGAPDNVAQSAYYLGVLRFSDASFGTSVRSFDAWLLGVPIGSDLGTSGYGATNSSYGGTISAPAIIDYDRMNLDATNFGAMTGRAEFRIDTVKGIITYLMPAFYGQITVEHGFGVDDNSLVAIPMNHFDIFSSIVCFEFLSIIINARTSIELNADFRINVNELSKRRDEFRERIRSDLPAISTMPLMWG